MAEKRQRTDGDARVPQRTPRMGSSRVIVYNNHGAMTEITLLNSKGLAAVVVTRMPLADTLPFCTEESIIVPVWDAGEGVLFNIVTKLLPMPLTEQQVLAPEIDITTMEHRLPLVVWVILLGAASTCL